MKLPERLDPPPIGAVTACALLKQGFNFMFIIWRPAEARTGSAAAVWVFSAFVLGRHRQPVKYYGVASFWLSASSGFAAEIELN